MQYYIEIINEVFWILILFTHRLDTGSVGLGGKFSWSGADRVENSLTWEQAALPLLWIIKGHREQKMSL